MPQPLGLSGMRAEATIGQEQAPPPILITTRFSFFGKSGWKSAASEDPDRLFARDRLEQRFWTFEHLTLPSLAMQTDGDFHHHVLSSRLMPDWAKERLRVLCEAVLPGRHSIRFARVGRSRRFQAMAIEAVGQGGPVAQAVLDDDDGLATDFVARLREAVAGISAEDPAEDGSKPRFVTFPHGYALGLREAEPVLWRQSYPFINLGLTMIGGPDEKNVLGIAHKSAPKRFGFRRFDTPPAYVRTLSHVNDSKVEERDRWTPVPEFRTTEDVETRFPWLISAPLGEYARRFPAPVA